MPSTEPPRRYELQPGLRAVADPSGMVYVVGELERQRVSASAPGLLLRSLVCPASEAELLASLAERLDPTSVLVELERLLSAGFVRRVDNNDGRILPRVESAYHGETSLPSEELEVVADVPTQWRSLAQQFLAKHSAAWVNPGDTLLVASDYLQPEVDAHLSLAEREGNPVTPLKLFGQRLWLGPRIASDGSCWQCLKERLTANRPVETWLQSEGTPPRDLLPHPVPDARQLERGLELLSTCIEQVRQGDGEHGLLMTLDLATGRPQAHRVVRRPQCRKCGNPTLMADAQRSAPKWSRHSEVSHWDGGHRVVSAEQTYARLAHHVSEFTGLVASLGTLTGKHTDEHPVFTANHFIRPAPGQSSADQRFEQGSVGKGRSMAQARTSALCEALERQSARYQGDEAHIVTSLGELGESAVDPRRLMLFSDAQYREGAPAQTRTRLAATPRSQTVPRRFDPEQVISWTPAWSLRDGTRRWVPLSYVFAATPQPQEQRFCDWDSNGCAAGNCLEEAVLQGLFELVERDATAIWWYNRACMPGIDLASFDNPYFPRVVEAYRELGHNVWTLDLTHDLRIPTVVALSHDPQTDRYAMGLGCHFDARIAVERAVTELHQVFDPKRAHAALFTGAELPNPAFIRPSEHLKPRQAADFASLAIPNLRAGVDACIGRLADAGLEPLVSDYSRPDVALHTVKVMVPGLRHFWPRLAPGRLYDVPVSMGWRSQPLRVTELNPMPLLM